MSYYIKPFDELKPGRMVMYRVVERLRDFKPDDGVEYMVFPNRKKMKTAIFVDLYIGKNGKLVKMKNKSLLRF